MPDLLQTGSAWLDAKRKAFMSHAVTYSRGAFSVSVLAGAGQTIFNIDDGGGAMISYESRDFLITATDLILNSILTTPLRGDRIVDVIGSSTFTFEVVAPKGLPDWRYTDAFKQTLRVHTKLIGTA